MGLEEINGDLLEGDFYGVIVTKVLRFFAFGTGRILQLVERNFRSASPLSFGSLPKAVGLTGQAPWLIYSSPQLTGRACSFFANAAALDVSLANIYGKVFSVTDKNKKLVELTTATGYKGLDPSKVDYYFGNLDERRRVTWSVGRDLIMQPPQEDGPMNALAKMYVAIDGKQCTDWTRELTYAEATK
jgi:hypothetical protein